MEIYREMDKRKFFRAAVLDTERVNEEEFTVQKGALAEEVQAKESYVQAYIRFVLGNVKKCESIEELRECKIVLHRIACFIKASVCNISIRITIQDELISVRQVCVNVFSSWKEKG